MYLNKNIKKRDVYSELTKWLSIFLLFFLAILVNYLFLRCYFVFKVLFFLLVFVFACLIAINTYKGKQFITFVQTIILELKQVIWPSRQETIYATLVVIGFTVLASLILWLVDSISVYIVSFILRF